MELVNIRRQNIVCFAWGGDGGDRVAGSTNYVNGLSQAEKDGTRLPQPRHGRLAELYLDGVLCDQTTFPPRAGDDPPGSAAIEGILESYNRNTRGEPYDDTQFSGRSDYQAFINNGIPSGGLFTGAEVPKTAAQAAIWGGTVGAQFDPCYHAACDTFDNNSAHAVEVNADAVAFSILTYAYSTESVNGVPGKKVPGNFQIPAPAGPEGTFVP